MQTQPIGVKCPRCDDDIACTVEVKLLTGHRTEMRLVDLADRFAEHYVEAGHVSSDDQRRDFGLAAETVNLSPAARVAAMMGIKLANRAASLPTEMLKQALDRGASNG